MEQATEWQIPISVMDCDVAAAFDHVSHHVIIDAMEVLKVPPLLVAAWIREYRGSETFVKLDDITTPGIHRTRSVPQRDPCALGQHWILFCERCQMEKWRLPLEEGYMGLFTFRGQLLDYRDVASRTKMQLVLGMNSWTKLDCASRGKRLFGVHRDGTVWRRPSRCPTQ